MRTMSWKVTLQFTAIGMGTSRVVVWCIPWTVPQSTPLASDPPHHFCLRIHLTLPASTLCESNLPLHRSASEKQTKTQNNGQAKLKGAQSRVATSENRSILAPRKYWLHPWPTALTLRWVRTTSCPCLKTTLNFVFEF
jgi:hypothetical protein